METEKLELEMAIQDAPKSLKAELHRLHTRVADLEDHITTLTTWKREGSLEVRGREVMVEQERRIVKLEAEAVEASHRLAEARLRADQMESQHKQAAGIATAATKELAAKSERVQELEAMLAFVGISAQRVTQGKDHIEQPIQRATTTVVLPEPIGTVGAAPGTSGFTLTVFEAARVPVGTNIYTEQQVRELLATGGQPQADARDNLLAALENLLASITGGQKQCGHDFDCVCPEDQARAAITAAKGAQK